MQGAMGSEAVRGREFTTDPSGKLPYDEANRYLRRCRQPTEERTKRATGGAMRRQNERSEFAALCVCRRALRA